MILPGIQPIQQIAAEFEQGRQPPHWVFGSRAGKEDRKVGPLCQLSGLQVVSFGQKDGLVFIGQLLKAQNQLT